ncbi:MAG TPA: hypothetical protein VF498_11495 [Anaerolineales bacterium]
MIITGIAHPPQRLRERNLVPSGELVYLARKALCEYDATHLITSLAPGWEQALAKAAIELEIPYTVAVPYPGRDASWDHGLRRFYLDLMARSAQVCRISECYTETALTVCRQWRADRSELLLALWEYEFQGDLFATLSYATRQGIQVVNLWQDWERLSGLRRRQPAYTAADKKTGARIFECKT